MTDTLTTAEAAAILGKSPRTVQRLARDGRLHPTRKSARLLLFERAEVERLADEQRQEGER